MNAARRRERIAGQRILRARAKVVKSEARWEGLIQSCVQTGTNEQPGRAKRIIGIFQVVDRESIKGLLPKTSRSGRISHFVIPAGLLGRNPEFSLSSRINE